MISYTKLYVDHKEALMGESGKKRLVSLIKILVWSSG